MINCSPLWRAEVLVEHLEVLGDTFKVTSAEQILHQVYKEREESSLLRLLSTVLSPSLGSLPRRSGASCRAYSACSFSPCFLFPCLALLELGGCHCPLFLQKKARGQRVKSHLTPHCHVGLWGSGSCWETQGVRSATGAQGGSNASLKHP